MSKEHAKLEEDEEGVNENRGRGGGEWKTGWGARNPWHVHRCPWKSFPGQCKSISLFSFSHIHAFYLCSSASLLAWGICQASGQIYISPDSLIGFKGFRTILILENATEDAQEYSWYRGANDTAENMIVRYKPPSSSWQTGPMYRGRENVTTLGDLVIRRSALNDTGDYTVSVDTGNGTQTATGWLEIQGELAGCPFPDLGALRVRSLGDHTVQISSTHR